MSQPHEFIRFALDTGVLRFGEFKTKAGRLSPYFFNAGLFHDGRTLGRLAGFYADRLLSAESAESEASGRSGDSAPAFDMLYGPAYKGIALASAMAVALAARGRNLPFAFNRKEAKDHGEGGNVIGAPLAGRVVIVDDVISAGTSVGESVAIIRAHGATPAAVLIALDRMERSGRDDALSEYSAVQEVGAAYGMPVVSIANLNDLLTYISAGGNSELAQHRDAVAAYRRRYGVAGA